MNKPNNYSIRTCINHMNAPKRTAQCLYLLKISRTITATDGSGDKYIDTYFQCNKTKRRIPKNRRRCINCIMYKPIVN